MSKTKKSPSDRRHEARRAIRLELNARREDWIDGGRSERTVHLSDLHLERLYAELRAAGGDPGDLYLGTTTAAYTQPPKPSVASMPGQWPTRRPAAKAGLP